MTLRRALAAAGVLLLIGAGCSRVAAPTPSPEGSTGQAPGTEQADEVDVAVDAYLEAVAEEQASAEQEDGDAALLSATDAELNAYSQTYDQAEF